MDRGVSGARESRPALDELVKAARRRRVDVLVLWALDRLGRNMKHLVMLLDDFTSLGVQFVSLREGLDKSRRGGTLAAPHPFGACCLRTREAERTGSGAVVARAKAEGQLLGRPRRRVTDAEIVALDHLPLRQAAAQLGVSKSFLQNWRVSRIPSPAV